MRPFLYAEQLCLAGAVTEAAKLAAYFSTIIAALMG
jgi:hypothetical protein